MHYVKPPEVDSEWWEAAQRSMANNTPAGVQQAIGNYQRGDRPRSTMTPTQRAHYIRDHGQAAYNVLPETAPSRRMPEPDAEPQQTRSAMTAAEKARFIRDHGSDVYLALPQ